MRSIIFSFMFLFSLSVNAQCVSCPVGTPVTLNASDYGVGTYSWICTNGFTSTDQAPEITPDSDVTCSLTFTNGICTVVDEVTIDVCDCPINNNPCVNLNYNEVLQNVSVTNTGTNISPVSTDIVEFRTINPSSSWSTLTMPATLSGCQIKEYVDATPEVAVVGGLFKLRLNNLNNMCGMPCSLKVHWVFGENSYNTTNVLSCGSSTTTEYSISVAEFQFAGYIANCYLEYENAYVTVLNQYRFSFIGAGPYPSDVIAETIIERQIYKEIEVRRTVTYSDGCDDEICTVPLTIPNQPPSECTNFVGFITSLTGCGSSELIGNFYNGSAPVIYQWKYNGSAISGETSTDLCMTGRPFGSYCLNAIDNDDCVSEVCFNQSTACNVSVSIAVSTTILQANVTGCGSPTFQWSRRIDGVWTEISGATSANYNTLGVNGWYEVKITCGPCFSTSTINILPPCAPVSSIIPDGESATVNVTGCNGTSINYVWEFYNGSSWNNIFSTSTTTTSLGVGFSEGNGLYRIRISCQGCTHQSQYLYAVSDPCQGFTASIVGSTPVCNFGSYDYSAIVTGTGPYEYLWTTTGSVSTSSTFTFEPTSNGVYVIVLNIEDANGCTFTANKIVTVSTCCTIDSDISPTSLSVCTNEFFAINGNYSGNTGSVSFAWTGSKDGGPEIFLSTDQTLINVFSLAGTYLVTFTVTDLNGCTSQNTINVIVTTCTDCFCTATLTESIGCTLYGVFLGAGCGNFNYQLQFSPTGTGWTSITSGVAGNGNTVTGGIGENGYYRIVLNSEICAPFTTPILTVDCVQDCFCDILEPSDNGCELSWDENLCEGYLITLQKFNGTNWVFASFESPYIYEQVSNNYRLVYQKGGCDNLISNAVSVVESLYEFEINPVSPATNYFIFDGCELQDPPQSEGCDDPYLPEGFIGTCEPYTGYIISGSANTWDLIISSDKPLTWSYSHYSAAINGNIFEVSRTSTSIRFTVKGAWSTCGCGAQPPVDICGTVIVNAMLRLIGTDDCGNVKFDRILLKHINN